MSVVVSPALSYSVRLLYYGWLPSLGGFDDVVCILLVILNNWVYEYLMVAKKVVCCDWITRCVSAS